MKSKTDSTENGTETSMPNQKPTMMRRLDGPWIMGFRKITCERSARELAVERVNGATPYGFVL